MSEYRSSSVQRGFAPSAVIVGPSQLGGFAPWLALRAHRSIGRALRRVTSTSELTQETLAIGIRRFSEIAGKPAPVVRAWLAGVMRRLVWNHLHHAGKAPEHLGSHEPADGGTPVPDKLVNRMLRHEVRRAVANLPEAERAVILGLYHDRATPDELAERLGRTAAAVYGLHHRALKRLEEQLAGLEP